MQNKSHNYAFYDKKPIISPAPHNFGVAGTLIGLFLRGFIIFMAIFSLSMLVNMSFELNVSGFLIFFTVFVTVIIFSLMSYFKYVMLGMSIVGLLYVIVSTLNTHNAGLKFFSSIAMTINKIFDKLIDIGYYGFYQKMIDVPLHVTHGVDKTFIVFVIILSSIFTFSCIRRTRILAPSIISSVILIPLFLYNIIEGNVLITLVICSMASIIIMRAFDKLYVKPKNSNEFDSQINITESAENQPFAKLKKHTPQASCGITGFCAFVLTFIILFIPCLKTEREFPTINIIDEKIEVCRQYITAYLMGNPDLLDELLYAIKFDNFNPRDLDLTEQLFTGEKILRVESQSNIPLYLRSWIATEYRSGKWLTAEYDGATYNSYSALFGKNDDPSSVMFADFCELINGNMLSSDLEYENKGIYKTEYGFTIMQVNIEKLSGKVNDTIFLPTYVNPLYPIRKYGSARTTDYTYTNFFDGIYTGRSFDKGTKYGIIACVPSYSDSSQVEEIAPFISLYTNIVDHVRPDLDRYVKRCLALEREGLYDENGEFKNDLQLNSIKDHILIELTNYRIYPDPNLPFYIEFSSIVSADEQDEFVDSLCNAYLYSDFVYKVYTGTARSEIITSYYEDIVENAKETVGQTTQKIDFSNVDEKFSTDTTAYLNRHKLVMEIINTITDEDVFEYVLIPTKKPDTSLDPIENFLTVTNEGYCMQFASAAVLLLREGGIPARYVEGYVALDFEENTDDDAVGSYVTTVSDLNSHAWIEVWYDGIGWVQYEATMISGYSLPGDETDTTTPSTTKPEDTTHLDTSSQTAGPHDTTTSPITSDTTTDDTTTDDSTSTDEPTTPDEPTTDTDPPRTDPPDTSDDTGGSNDSTVTIDSTGDDIDPITRARNSKIIIISIISIVSVLTLSGSVAFVIISNKKSIIAQTQRNELIVRINTGNYQANEERKIALTVAENVAVLIKTLGSAPRTGELFGEYATRLNSTYPDVFKNDINAVEMVYQIAAEEFGSCMNKNGMFLLAHIYTQLYTNKKKYLNIFERVYYRIIKHLI